MKKLTILLLLFILINEANAQWANLTIHSFECVQSDDYDETDEIQIHVGNTMYDLGSIKDGELKSLSGIIGTVQFKNDIKIEVVEMDGVGFINGHDYKKPFYPNYDDASARGVITYTINEGFGRAAIYNIRYTVTTN
jgi:hypothetical protein